ncbi:MAG: ferritin-like domain-containing protein [Thermoproteota archaeon]|nr:ferritin-like domain-containing protein [Thermoproteota archaeon]
MANQGKGDDLKGKMSSSAELTPNANQKIVQYLNDALAMENASEERIRLRLQGTIVDDIKKQLQQHLVETQSQKDRLKQIVTSHGGKHTDAKATLPFLKPNTLDVVRDESLASSNPSGQEIGSPSSPEDASIKSIVKETDNIRLAAEKELIETEQDAIIENAEIVKYRFLREIAKKIGAMDAVLVIDQNLKEEEQMANWITANTSNMLRQLWAQIEVSAGARTAAEA